MLVEESVADQRCQQCQGFILRLHDLAFLHFRRFGQVGYLVTVQTWQRTKSWRASCHFAIFPSLVNFDFCFILSLVFGLRRVFSPRSLDLGFILSLVFGLFPSFWLWSFPFILAFIWAPLGFILALHLFMLPLNLAFGSRLHFLLGLHFSLARDLFILSLNRAFLMFSKMAIESSDPERSHPQPSASFG